MKEQEIKEKLKNGKVLIDFYADWCSPCKMMKPILNQFQNEQDEISVVKINVDEFSEMANVYGIRSIPTLIYMEDGEVINRAAGGKPIDELYRFTGLTD